MSTRCHSQYWCSGWHCSWPTKRCTPCNSSTGTGCYRESEICIFKMKQVMFGRQEFDWKGNWWSLMLLWKMNQRILFSWWHRQLPIAFPVKFMLLEYTCLEISVTQPISDRSLLHDYAFIAPWLCILVLELDFNVALTLWNMISWWCLAYMYEDMFQI